MADLVFRQGIANTYFTVSLNLISNNELREATASGNFQTRDVVRITYTPSGSYQRAVYAVCTSSAGAATFQFDDNIYPVDLSSISATIYQYNATDVYDTEAYRIGVNIENGVYSKAYIQYASNNTYNLTIPNRRNVYFGSSDTIITQPNVAFADLCDNKAYGVSLTDGSFDLLNNKYKSSLEFNIATR